MFSERSHSQTQKSRLAISLAWVGGFTNVVVLLACATAVSHVSGNTSQLGHHLANGDGADILFLGFLVGCFLVGATFSGWLTESATRRHFRSKYAFPVIAEGLFLILVNFLLIRLRRGDDSLAMKYSITGVASLAMGLQNATLTKISGGVLRTTHVTGVLTDFGIELSRLWLWMQEHWANRTYRIAQVLWVSRRHPSFLRMLLLGSIFGSFLFGAFVAAWTHRQWPEVALWPPVVFLGWMALVDLRSPIAEIRHLASLVDTQGSRFESVFRAESKLWISTANCDGSERVHHAPSFQRWADSSPPDYRVAILDLSPQIRLDADAILDLEIAIKKLAVRHRVLVLSCSSEEHRKYLGMMGITLIISPPNLCASIEDAIEQGKRILAEDAAVLAVAPRPPAAAEAPPAAQAQPQRA